VTRSHKTTTSSSAAKDNWNRIVANVYNHYLESTPQRTKLIDAFMVFLVAVGGLQFLYCILAGNYVRTPGSDETILW
jgi:oligosaccharyltransferase complex subunit epsilon